MKYDLTQVMTEAHAFAKANSEAYGDYQIALSEGLRQSWGKEKIKTLTTDELEAMLLIIKEELEARKNEQKQEWTFNFETTTDPRKGSPYVAYLSMKEDKMERDFVNSFSKVYGKKEITVKGSYKASQGQIVEIRTGGSWKNDYRAWYLVNNGELVCVADITDSADKAKVMDYLKGEITASELLA